MQLRIYILLSEFYNPAAPARPEVMEIYGNYFPRLGHHVTWIMPTEGNEGEIRAESLGDVRIFAVRDHIHPFLPWRVFAKLLYLRKTKKMIDRMVERGESRTIIQARKSILEGMLGVYLAKKLNVPFAFHYSSPVVGWHEGHSASFHLADKIADSLSVLMMRQADLVVTTSGKWLGQYLIQKGIPESKLLVTSNCANIDLFTPLRSASRIREKYGLEKARVIVYVGALDRYRQLEILIEAFSIVTRHEYNIKLLVVGEGNGKSSLEELAHECKVRNDVIFTGQMCYWEMPSFIAAAAVCVSPIPPLRVYEMSSPLKMLEYMAMA